jgi:hypothetical protein
MDVFRSARDAEQQRYACETVGALDKETRAFVLGFAMPVIMVTIVLAAPLPPLWCAITLCCGTAVLVGGTYCFVKSTTK